VLADYETEIAKEGAEIAVPETRELLDGVEVAVRPRSDAPDRRVELRFLLTRPDPASLDRPVRPGATFVGALFLPRVATLRFEGSVAIEAGGSSGMILLGRDPDAPERRLVLLVAAAALPR
jgi:hypothetical protein